MGHMRYPKGPCTQIVYTMAPNYLYRDYCKAEAYTIWVHLRPSEGSLLSVDDFPEETQKPEAFAREDELT